MRVAHQRSWQSCAGIALAVIASGCAASEPEPSIWPPADFRCELEQVELRDGVSVVTQRVRFEGSGVVVYGTSAQALIDPTTRTALPVFDRLAVYRLVPASLRSLARRLNERGITTIDATQGERGGAGDRGLVLRWRAFGSERLLTVRGRVHGQMGQILDLVAAMLPDGEHFAYADGGERAVVSVLRGVPKPAVDAAGALAVHLALLRDHGEDPAWLLDAFALACRAGDRAAAEALLGRWAQREAVRSLGEGTFADWGDGRLTADVLQRLLPPAGSG